MIQQRGFDFQGGELVAATLDDVDAAAADEAIKSALELFAARIDQLPGDDPGQSGAVIDVDTDTHADGLEIDVGHTRPRPSSCAGS